MKENNDFYNNVDIAINNIPDYLIQNDTNGAQNFNIQYLPISIDNHDNQAENIAR